MVNGRDRSECRAAHVLMPALSLIHCPSDVEFLAVNTFRLALAPAPSLKSQWLSAAAGTCPYKYTPWWHFADAGRSEQPEGKPQSSPASHQRKTAPAQRRYQ